MNKRAHTYRCVCVRVYKVREEEREKESKKETERKSERERKRVKERGEDLNPAKRSKHPSSLVQSK